MVCCCVGIKEIEAWNPSDERVIIISLRSKTPRTPTRVTVLKRLNEARLVAANQAS